MGSRWCRQQSGLLWHADPNTYAYSNANIDSYANPDSDYYTNSG